ncbi:PstS family phosphate ABC transporter substrate-binding protein [Natronomonas salina]|uniref:PstS family phosphate ABC transporter substrate-binding protein n=1 Tax=Natronomonas salina TaxID=1710540 RepID=UPI0015B66B41|nr:PstS family phosphate ABC transporter substrate-binding protein [Natronomonas salina]QLD89981.1 PstS family phosphate ABC transporter substrate-binding protein [Natronomonas salina]
MVSEPETDGSRVESSSRRAFIAGGAALGGALVAGCTETGGNDDGNNSTGGDGNGGSGDLSGEIVITGSSTVFPVSDAMAEEFMKQHSGVDIPVDSTGTGGGFENHFCPGNSDINGASRPIKDSELEQCQSNDVEPVEFQVASDALTVAVNNDADWVDCMTFDELSQIWREDGAQQWSDVRDDWPDEDIELFGPASTSGTYDWFNENVVGEDHGHTAQHEPTEEDNLIVQGIRDSPYAMGYFGFAYYQSNSDQVKAVEVKTEESGSCTPPSLENAKDGSYPLARPLFIYPNESAVQQKHVYEFLKFYFQKAETDMVSDIGYVPSSTDLRDENLGKLDELAGN